MTELLRCSSCGGAVVWDAAQSGAGCLFCGTVALELHWITEPLPIPEAVVAFTITAAEADRRFRSWARKSWFRPRELSFVGIGLRPLLVPVWRVHAALETHWAGLQLAETASGRAPLSGVEHGAAVTMVPASAGLDPAELLKLQPFDETDARPWTEYSAEPGTELIWEPPSLTRRAARVRAQPGLASVHADQISDAHGLTRCRVDTLVDERDVRLLLIPIYVGVFRFRDRPWRFVINGQSGAVVGDAPLDRLRVAIIALLTLAIAVIWICIHSRG